MNNTDGIPPDASPELPPQLGALLLFHIVIIKDLIIEHKCSVGYE